MAGATGEWRTLMLLGYTTGMRLKDACLLEWAAINLDAKVLRLDPAKTKRRGRRSLEVPILPDLMAALLATPEGKRKGPVLPAIAARYRRNHVAPSREAQKLFRQSQVFDTEEGRAGFHSFRTTWQSLNDAAGTSRVISRAVLGHTGAAVSDTYSRTDADAARKAVEKAVPRVVGG